MLDKINSYRSEKGTDDVSTKALIYDYDLEKAAMQRVAEIVVRFDEDDHYRPDGYTYEKTLQEYGFNISGRGILYAENILSYVSDNPSTDTAFDALTGGFTGEIMLGEANYVGIGHARVNNTEYWVQLFSNEQDKTIDFCDALVGEKDINIYIPDKFVESVTPVYVSGDTSVAEGSSVETPVYTAKVKFKDSDAGEVPVVGNLIFESEDYYVKALNGTMTGLKAGTGKISASLLGKIVSVDITVTGESSHLQQLIANAEVLPNTTLTVSDDQIAKSAADVQKLIYDYVGSNILQTGLVVESFDYLQEEENYAALFPSVKAIEFSEAKVYANVSAVTCKINYKENSFTSEERAVDYALTNGNESNLTSTENQLLNKIKELAASLKGNSESDTVKNIHDYLVKNIAYTLPKNQDDMSVFSVRGALYEFKSVCDGYAKSFYLLCKANGIDAVYVTGTATNSTGTPESHAWNKVKIDNKWYSIDCTWDDPVPDEAGRVLYTYYLMTDEAISADHQWDNSDLPKAT